MIAIANKNKKNNKFLPMISLVQNKEVLKKECKKQLINEILENPQSIKAYKEIEVYKIADISDDIELKNIKKELLFTYEELLKEIIEILNKEKKDVR